MFRLNKAAIIRRNVSEDVEIKLYSCNHTYDYKIYGRDLALILCISCCMQPKYIAAMDLL